MYPNKLTRNLLFASLYFTQGTILGYFASLNALYLISRGLSMTDVGIFGAIALIPFVIKIFLGMWSDRVNLFGRGHRVPYILIGLAVQLMHRGPYNQETANIQRLHDYVAETGRNLWGAHHEIYLSDPGRTKPENMKTIIRQPMR